MVFALFAKIANKLILPLPPYLVTNYLNTNIKSVIWKKNTGGRRPTNQSLQLILPIFRKDMGHQQHNEITKTIKIKKLQSLVGMSMMILYF